MKQKTIWRLGLEFIGSHFTAVIINLLITISLMTISAENLVLQIIVGTFVILLYWALIGAPAYKLGYDDLNRVNFKRMDEDLSRGFKIGLVVFGVLAVQMIVLLLGKMALIPDFFVAYKFLNPHLLIPINLVKLTAYLSQVSWGQLIAIFSFNLLTPILIGLSYIMGYKNITVIEKIIYQNKKPQEDKRRR